MNNKGITRKATVAGVVGLTAAGVAAAVVLANDPAADSSDSKSVQRQESSSVQAYTGPRTADAADAAEAWLQSATSAYTGPRTADAAEAWLQPNATTYTGPRTADAAVAWRQPNVTTYTGPTTPDAAESWSAAGNDAQPQHREPSTESVADLYEGIDRRWGPLGVHTP